MGTSVEQATGNSQRESYFNQLRSLLDNFSVDGVNIYNTDRILAKLALMPDYVAQETLNGLQNKNASPEYHKVLLDKWGKKDSKTKKFAETPEMVFYRTSRLAADGLSRNNQSQTADITTDIFYKFINREIFPNTPYMANGGHRIVAEELESKLRNSGNPPDSALLNELNQESKIKEQLFACFVLDLYDSRESIFKTIGDAAAIQASIGGTGFNFSNLRPANETLHGTGGITDGPVSFMAMYSNALGKTMNQGGKREGANMFMLDWNHPDVIRFIYSKSSDGTVSAANISVAIDHEFMKAAKAEGEERFYPLINPHYNPELRPHIPRFYSEEQLKDAAGVVGMNKKSKLSLILDKNGVDVLSPWLPEGLGEEYRIIGKIKDGFVYLDAKKVLRHLAFGAWFNGEPGAIITGHINDHNPTHPRNFKRFLLEQKDPESIQTIERIKKEYPGKSLEQLIDDYIGEKDEQGKDVNLPIGVGEMRATNPCGEKPLLGNEACVLGHTNLEKILNKSNTDPSDYTVNWRNFEESTRLLTRILDNAIDQNHFTNPDIEKTQKSNRKIGVGFMGLANMLYRLELPYNSHEARSFVDELLKFWEEVSDDESFRRGEELGAFPNFKYSHHRNGRPKRNAIVRTLAPTGTTAFVAQTTGGMEPEYALVYERTTVQGTKVDMFNPVLQEKLEKYNFLANDDEASRFHELVKTKGSLQEFEIKRGQSESEEEFKKREENLSRIKNIFVTTYDISPEDHLRMQSIVQSHVDDSISKTTNFRNSATVEDIENAFILAYDLGIKGITFYRDGTRKGQPLQIKGSAPGNGERGLEGIVDVRDVIIERLNRPRPEFVFGPTVKAITPFGNSFVNLSFEYDKNGKPVAPYETFISIGKGGKDVTAMAEALARSISLGLKGGIPVECYSEQFRSIGGETQVGIGENRVTSLPDAVAKALDSLLQQEAMLTGNGVKNNNHKKREGTSGNFCPSCGRTLIFVEGCEKCACGFSKCS